jgi:drug/metabolite transporter (DMT)-like permease
LVPVVTKETLDGFSPEAIGTIRLGAAAVTFRLLAGRSGSWLSSDPWIWLAGIALGVDFILYNYGVQRTRANLAGLVVNVEVVTTIVLARWILGERFGRRQVLGALVTLAGVVVATLDTGPARTAGETQLAGNLMVMAAGVSWSVFAVAQRRSADGEPSFRELAPIFAVATVVAAPTVLLPTVVTPAPTARATVQLAVLAFACTAMVYALYARAQRLVDVSVLAVVLCALPIFVIGFASLLLAEPLTMPVVGGALLVTAGIVVVARAT